MFSLNLNLDDLPQPQIIDPLDFEAILKDIKEDFNRDGNDLGIDTLDLESDSNNKLMQAYAYRELKLRARMNHLATVNMVAQARGADLDGLVASFGVSRLLIDPGEPTASPPRPATFETDTALRERWQFALEAYSVAGPQGAYIYHSKSASGLVKSATAYNPQPGHVTVVILSHQGNGHANQDLISVVDLALNDDRIRPLTDLVTVRSAEIIPYEVQAILEVEPGNKMDMVYQAAETNLKNLAQTTHQQIGLDVAVSALYRALHVAGVRRVRLTNWQTDLQIDRDQAAFLTAFTITLEASHDIATQ